MLLRVFLEYYSKSEGLRSSLICLLFFSNWIPFRNQINNLEKISKIRIDLTIVIIIALNFKYSTHPLDKFKLYSWCCCASLIFVPWKQEHCEENLSLEIMGNIERRWLNTRGGASFFARLISSSLNHVCFTT